MLINDLDHTRTLPLIDLITDPVFAVIMLSVFALAFIWQHVRHAERLRSVCFKHAGGYLVYSIISIGAVIVLTDVARTIWPTDGRLNILVINIIIVFILCLIAMVTLIAIWSLNKNRDVQASRARLRRKGAKDRTAPILAIVSLLMLWSYFSDENIMTGVNLSLDAWLIQIGFGLLLSLGILLTVIFTKRWIGRTH